MAEERVVALQSNYGMTRTEMIQSNALLLTQGLCKLSSVGKLSNSSIVPWKRSPIVYSALSLLCWLIYLFILSDLTRPVNDRCLCGLWIIDSETSLEIKSSRTQTFQPVQGFSTLKYGKYMNIYSFDKCSKVIYYLRRIFKLLAPCVLDFVFIGLTRWVLEVE